MLTKLKSNAQFNASSWLCSSVLAGCLVLNSAVGASAGVLDETRSITAPHQSTNVTAVIDQKFILYTQLAGVETSQRVPMLQLAQSEAEDVNDPLEGFNRAVFSFNQGFYDFVLGPLSDVYLILPTHARTAVGSVLDNLSSPVVLLNDILQGEPVRAFSTARRFVINTVFGLGGLADVATSFGIEEHDEDFGQTLAVWGVGEGFYLVLPILGPSNPRDAIGKFLVDPWVDPVGNYLLDHGHDEAYWARFGTSAVHDFSLINDDLDQLESTSVDYYAAVRSLYRQKRKVAISNGNEMELPSIPDFEFGDYPQDPTGDPSIGGVGDTIGDDDQLSYNTLPQLGQGDLLINDPFTSSFQPVEGANEGQELVAGDVPLSPRKPSLFSVNEDDALVLSANYSAK